MMKAAVTGVSTGAIEKFVNSVPNNEAVKLGAVMAGSSYVTNKAMGYMGMAGKPGTELLLSTGLYAFVAPKVTPFVQGTMTTRALAALGGNIVANVATKTIAKYEGSDTDGMTLGVNQAALQNYLSNNSDVGSV